MRLLLDTLNKLEAEVEMQAKADVKLLHAASAELSLGPRQRAILSHAVRNPDTEFVIRTHQAAHGIAYSTAREDFLQLVSRGYLEQRQTSRGYVFTVSPGLRNKLGEDGATQ